MKSQEVLKNMLARIDHRGYPAYKELQGMYAGQRGFPSGGCRYANTETEIGK